MFAVPAPPTPIVAVDRPTQVSAYGSGVLFSKRDPASGRFQLWYTETGRPPAPLPVAARAVPFDADLGPGAHGHFLAVYSRCAREPAWNPEREDAPPDYTRGRGCRLYELDLTTGAERRLPGTGVLPSVWEDRVAFARARSLYTRRDGEAARRVHGLPASGRPAALDLYGRRLAVAWSRGETSELRLGDLATGRMRVVERYLGGALSTVTITAPAFQSGTLYYAKLCRGDESGCRNRAGLVRYRYSTGDRDGAPISVDGLWQARGEGVTYVLTDNPLGGHSCHSGQQATCTLEGTTPDFAG